MDEKHTNEALTEIVDIEGLEYAILSYVDPEKIADPVVKEIWLRAKEAMEELEEILLKEEW